MGFLKFAQGYVPQENQSRAAGWTPLTWPTTLKIGEILQIGINAADDIAHRK